MLYEIDTVAHLVTLDLVGAPSPDAITRLIARLSNDSRYHPSMKIFCDFSRCDFTDVTTAQIRRLAAIWEPEEYDPKVAIYAPDDLAYGLARLYVSEASMTRERDRRVFKEYRPAMAWLMEDEGRQQTGGP